jgi:hypothetical protein
MKLNDLKQYLRQEDLRKNAIAEELEESRRMGRQPSNRNGGKLSPKE